MPVRYKSQCHSDNMRLGEATAVNASLVDVDQVSIRLLNLEAVCSVENDVSSAA